MSEDLTMHQIGIFIPVLQMKTSRHSWSSYSRLFGLQTHSFCCIRLSCWRCGGWSCANRVPSCDPFLELSSLFQALSSYVFRLWPLAINYLLRPFLALLPPSPFASSVPFATGYLGPSLWVPLNLLKGLSLLTSCGT